MNSKSIVIAWFGILIAIVIAAASLLVAVESSNKLGATGTRFPNGLSADNTSPVAGQVRGTTLTVTGASTFGGTGTFTTSNTATSTVKVGCIQMNATSTASPGKLILASSGATTTYTGALSFGVVAWVFGTCP